MVSASDYVDLASSVAAHKNATVLVDSQANRTETAARAFSVVGVPKEMLFSFGRIGASDRHAVLKRDAAQAVTVGRLAVPASVERDQSSRAVLQKVDIQRRKMRAECDLRGNRVLLAPFVVDSLDLIASHVLTDDSATREVLDVGCVGDGNASGVAEVLAVYGGAGVVGTAVVVELLTRVAVVDIVTVARHVVNRVLNGPDVAVARVVSDSDAVAQAPANDLAAGVLGGIRGRQKTGNVKRAKLATGGRDVLGRFIDVAVGASGNEEHVGVVARHKKRSCRVTALVHADDDLLAFADSAIGSVVGIRKNGRQGRDKQRLAILGESNAVVELAKVRRWTVRQHPKRLTVDSGTI